MFSGGYWGNPASNTYTSLADDIDIRVLNSDVGLTLPLAGVFQVWVDNSDSTMGYRNQTYQNIRIDNYAAAPVLLLKNVVYPFGGPSAVSPPLGNSSNLVFKNISVEGTQRYLSEIKGLDANNGFHNVTLDNFSFNGVVVNQSNLGQYFDVNSFVTGLGYTAPTPPCVADATTLCLADNRFRVRATYDTDTASGDGKGVALTSDTGYFWFFSPSNVEMVVKVLNGCGLNQNFWVFAGGLTNVGVTLTVTDTRTGITRIYRNVRGTAFLPLQRTTEFSVCNAVAASMSARAWRKRQARPGHDARRSLGRRRDGALPQQRALSGARLVRFGLGFRRWKWCRPGLRYGLLLVLLARQRRGGRQGLEWLRRQPELLGLCRRAHERRGEPDGHGHPNGNHAVLPQRPRHGLPAAPADRRLRRLPVTVFGMN